MELLVNKAKTGDKKAFMKLIDNKIDVLYKIAYSYLKNSFDASDAVQDSILLAFENIKKLYKSESFNSWIISILINRCKDILKKNKKYTNEELNENIIYNYRAKDDYSIVEEHIDILNYLNMLDEKYYDVIYLKYIGDLTIYDIAKTLEIPEGTVKSRLNYGLKRLKQIMEVKNYGM